MSLLIKWHKYSLMVLIWMSCFSLFGQDCNLDFEKLVEAEARLDQALSQITQPKEVLAQKLKKSFEAEKSKIQQLVDGIANQEALDEPSWAETLDRLKDLESLQQSSEQLFVLKKSLAGKPGGGALEGVEAQLAKMIDQVSENKGLKTSEQMRLDKIMANMEKASKLPITYVNPGHHDPARAGVGGEGLRPGGAANTSKLPPNHEELWRKAIPSDDVSRVWWSFDEKTGELHRFAGQMEGDSYKLHWNGSTQKGELQINNRDIPIDIRRYFGLSK